MNKTCLSWSELGSQLPCVVIEMMIAWKVLPAIQSPGFSVSALEHLLQTKGKDPEFLTLQNVRLMVFPDV